MIISIPLFVIMLAELQAAGVLHWEDRIRSQATAESAWNPLAESPWAKNIMQFVDSTYEWIAPDIGCEGVDIFDVRCAFRAGIEYMSRQLRTSRDASSPEEVWAFAWARYNMGPGNIRKEKRACRMRLGCSSDTWTDNVELMCNRTRPGACEETRRYVRRIRREIIDPYLRPPVVPTCPRLGWIYTACPREQRASQLRKRAETVFSGEWIHH